MGTYKLQGKKVFIAGHQGMVGKALTRALEKEECQILTVTRKELDLQNQAAVNQWFKDQRPEVIFLAAAKVGGILANTLYPAEFIYENLMIQQNVINAAHQSTSERLIFLGSSCIYPRMSPQPIPEEALLSGPLEETNQWYAIAKIAGLKLIEAFRKQYQCDFISIMPTNLYGPGDHYDSQNSHVIPALILKFHTAKMNGHPTVNLWGTGTPLREFLHVDDLADACLFLAKNYSDSQAINVGTGKEISIKDLAAKISQVVGYKGEVNFDATKPDGTPRKLLDISKIAHLGWSARTPLDEGLKNTYQDFLTKGIL
ncbi:MAG: GDP-L-fucose synthase [Alphaproteobacteria bacterium]|nr:GDP-L-fucose synthase [Alphaproteobacteria bacterium]